MQLIALIDFCFFPLLAALLWLWIVKGPRRLPLPPGPKRRSLLGNALELPRFQPWITFHRWAQELGSDLIFLQVPFQPIIVVESVQVALELMDKRSRIYSDKPISVMDELTGWKWNLALQRYGPAWRATRRYFHQYFYQGAVRQYHEAGKREVRAFLRRALQSQEGLDVRSVHQLYSALIMDIVYGIKVESMENEYVVLMESSGESFGLSKTPGAFWIDSFPLMKYVPAWFPGAAARKFGEIYKPIVLSMRERPFHTAKLNTTDRSNIVQKILRKIENFPDDLHKEHEELAKDAAGIAYVASIETTLNTTSWFIVAMALHLSVQDKVRKELDAVVGTDRLPEFSDLKALPYLQAVYMETQRWKPVVPVGIPHRVMQEDEYNGLRIPKGSIIIPNAWAMLNNPDDYPSPENFDPERFLKDGHIDRDVRDPATIVFRFGRRICPGRYFAKEMLLLTFASILSVYDILPAAGMTGPDGKPVDLKEEEEGVGILARPKNLGYCVLKPRSASAVGLIEKCGDL